MYTAETDAKEQEEETAIIKIQKSSCVQPQSFRAKEDKTIYRICWEHQTAHIAIRCIIALDASQISFDLMPLWVRQP